MITAEQRDRWCRYQDSLGVRVRGQETNSFVNKGYYNKLISQRFSSEFSSFGSSSYGRAMLKETSKSHMYGVFFFSYLRFHAAEW